MTGLQVAALVLVAFIAYAIVSTVLRSVFNPILPVDDTIVVDLPVDKVNEEVAILLGTARRVEFSMTGQGGYQLAYTSYPGWSIALGVVTFPIGLLFIYLARERLALNLTVVAEEGHTRIRVFGRIHKKLAESTGRALQIQLGARV